MRTKGWMTMQITNTTAYRFVTLAQNRLSTIQRMLKEKALLCHLKGTILLGTEGVNLMLAGVTESIMQYKTFLNTWPEFTEMLYKDSASSFVPFQRMIVHIRKEIVTMNYPDITPEHNTAPRLSPEVFKQWYEEGRDMVVLDARNDYEVALGRFNNAMHLHIKNFRSFPNAINKLPDDLKEKPIVAYCTGGIRCEKATALMMKKGFKHVYQLDGGILHYFEKCGGNYYSGNCFVFDDRIAIGVDKHDG